MKMTTTGKVFLGIGIAAALAGGTWLTISLMSKPKSTGDDDYAKHLKAGNDAMAKKDYAKAKEEYSMLLLIRPGDKTAIMMIKAVDEAIVAAGGDPNKPTNTTIPNPDYHQPANDTPTLPPSKLPNDGVNCGSIKTDHDGNYDYVKCAGVWNTRSKAEPKTPGIKGTIPNWKSLATNQHATQILNTAYPQG